MDIEFYFGGQSLLSSLNISLHILLACMISDQKTTVILILVPPKVTLFIPLASFKSFSVSDQLQFEHTLHRYMCMCVCVCVCVSVSVCVRAYPCLVFILPGVLRFLNLLCVYFGTCQQLLLQIFLLIFFFSFYPFCYPKHLLKWSHNSWMFSSVICFVFIESVFFLAFQFGKLLLTYLLVH